MESQDQLGIHGTGVHAFLFKHHANSSLPQGTDGAEHIHTVAPKPGDGFAEDQVDTPLSAGPKHPFEILSVLHAGTGNSLIGIDVHQFPARVLGDGVGIIPDLRAIGIELVFGIGGHPAVCRHFFKFFRLRFIGLNDLYLCHLAHLRSPEQYQNSGRKSIPNVARCTPSLA